MTLSRWLRDYLYIPLGGNRRGRLMTYRNLMLTMLIGGLWHGAAWTFVVWGGLHGLALASERWWHERRGPATAPDPTRNVWLARIATFHFVCFAWIFFRADSFSAAWDMIEGLFTGWGEASPLVTGGVLLAIAVGIGSQYLPARIPRIVMARFSRLPVLGQATVLALALMLTSVLGPEGVAPLHLLPVLMSDAPPPLLPPLLPEVDDEPRTVERAVPPEPPAEPAAPRPVGGRRRTPTARRAASGARVMR